MAKFLKESELNAEMEKLFEKANEQFVLFSLHKYTMRQFVFWMTFFSFIVIGCSSNNDPVDPSSSGRNNNNCKKTNCADYTSQAAAQAAFNADRICHDDLDQDNDGIACEEPGNAVSKNDCPNTSNCGCSGKTKANCPNDPCCKWVVGDGCKCK